MAAFFDNSFTDYAFAVKYLMQKKYEKDFQSQMEQIAIQYWLYFLRDIEIYRNL